MTMHYTHSYTRSVIALCTNNERLRVCRNVVVNNEQRRAIYTCTVLGVQSDKSQNV